MSSPSINTLSVGLQHLYKYGLLPSALSVSALDELSGVELHQLAVSALALTQSAALARSRNEAADTVSLSPVAKNTLAAAVNSRRIFGLNPTADQRVVNSAGSAGDQTISHQIDELA